MGCRLSSVQGPIPHCSPHASALQALQLVRSPLQRVISLQPFTTLRYLAKKQRYHVAAALEAPERELIEQRWTQQQWAGLWTSNLTEEAYWVDAADVEGKIPEDIEGTWFRNGPGVFELDGHKMHVFDGHGLIGRLAFSGGRVHFASRFVRTEVFEAEMRHNRVLFRGFGTTKPGGMLANVFDIRDKPVANTSLVEWTGKLWALWEADLPHILDPVSLHTLGQETLGGSLRKSQAFCAHPQYDAATGRLIAFSLGLRHAEGNLHIWEINPDSSVYQKITLAGIFNPVTYLHDFTVTPSWYIFHRPPLKVQFAKLGGYLLGVEDQTKMVAFDSSKSGQWLLVSRDPHGPRLEINTPPQFIWHYASAHEDPATGVLTVDACVFDEFSPGDFDLKNPETLSGATLRRCTVDPASMTATHTEVTSFSGDFPTINRAFAGCSDYQYVYMAACTEPESAFPFQSVVKVSMQSGAVDEWRAANGAFVGEAVFVPRKASAVAQPPGGHGSTGNNNSSTVNSGASASFSSNRRIGGSTSSGLAAGRREDDGWLITPLYDGKRDKSSVVILDARDLSSGPVAQIYLKSVMPFAFHCLWSDGVHAPKV